MDTRLITHHKSTSLKNPLLLLAIATVAISGIVALAYNAHYGHFNSLVSENNTIQESIMRDLFSEWKDFHGKHYSSPLEHEQRFKIFIDNYNYIKEYNTNPENTAILGLTIFADLTNQEYRLLKPRNPDLNKKATEIQESSEDVEIDISALPASVDWRTKGVILPVFTMGQCTSCWAVIVVQTLASLNAINGGELTAFSAQQVTDCSYSYGNNGCGGGGLPAYAFNYTSKYGVETEAAYPWIEADAKCKYNASEVVYKNTGWGTVPVGNSVAMAAAVVNQPISVAVDTQEPVFQLYTSGIITSASCGTDLEGTMLVVGYSSQAGQDYWICQNNWGTSWGMEGYVYIAKGNSTKSSGTCGIAMIVNYPTV
jgi:C1A family cysteine protease